MRVRQWFGVVVLGVAALLCGATARAAFITYTLTTTASGTIDGTTETNAPLTVTVTYDPSRVTQPVPNDQDVVNQSVAVSFGGITDTITTTSETNYHNAGSSGFMSIGQPVAGATGLLILRAVPGLANISLTNPPSGPLSVTGDTNGTTYNTTEGSIALTGVGTITYALQPAATAVPEPSSLTLLSLGALGLAGYGWRRRRWAAA
jgi:hypothetical protein